VAQPGGAAAW